MEINNFIIQEVNRSSKCELDIHWYMTDWCNYHCEYCKGDNSYPWVPYEQITKIADQLNIIIDKLGLSVKLFLVGGEVTYYDLSDLIKNHLTSKNLKRFALISNMSRDLEFFKTLKQTCDDRGIIFGLRGSVHLTQIKDMDAFIEKLQALPFTRLNLVLNKENYQRTENFLDLMADKKLTNQVDILFDKRPNQRSEDVLRVYNKYTTSLNIKKTDLYKTTLDNGETLDLSRADLTVYDYDFTGYRCTGIPRVKTWGVVTSGACAMHNSKSMDLEELSSKSMTDIKDFLTVTCEQRNCPLCTFTKIAKR